MDQRGVEELAENQHLVLICGRYEGIDERVIQTEIDEEWSIGDYVLSGRRIAGDDNDRRGVAYGARGTGQAGIGGARLLCGWLA